MFYIIDDIMLPDKTAGSKARRDINFFLKPEKEVFLFQHDQKGIAQMEIKSNQRKVIKEVKEDDVVLIHWPLYLRKPFNGTEWISKVKGFKIAVIHDINSLRDQESAEVVQKEVAGLNRFQVVIVHNKKMKQWLLEHGLTTRMVVLGVFDYKGETDAIPERTFQKKEKYEVVVAGNLAKEKAGYIYRSEKADAYCINAYGVNYEQNDNVNYKGSFEADELPEKLEGDFGLVWDGQSTKECEGNTGNYLRYNNPHKVSLYIRSNLPIIIWEQAALASFVKEHEIGFTIRHFDEISEKLSQITEEQYNRYLKNLEKLAKETEEGAYIKKAFKEAVSFFQK